MVKVCVNLTGPQHPDRRIPHFSKVHINTINFINTINTINFTFVKRPTFALVLTNGRKSEEDFCFYENRGKVRIQCLAGHFQGSAHPK